MDQNDIDRIYRVWKWSDDPLAKKVRQQEMLENILKLLFLAFVGLFVLLKWVWGNKQARPVVGILLAICAVAFGVTKLAENFSSSTQAQSDAAPSTAAQPSSFASPSTSPPPQSIANSSGPDFSSAVAHADSIRLAATSTDSAHQTSPANLAVKGSDLHTVAALGQVTNRGIHILEQSSQGMLWTQNDNGVQANWFEANSFCSAQGTGWRLPSTNELGAIFDASGNSTTACGSFTCKASPAFHLTAGGYWTNEEVGQSNAMVFVLDGGTTYQGRKEGRGNVRALCVKTAASVR